MSYLLRRHSTKRSYIHIYDVNFHRMVACHSYNAKNYRFKRPLNNHFCGNLVGRNLINKTMNRSTIMRIGALAVAVILTTTSCMKEDNIIEMAGM